jgi:hypothetical protein
MKLAESPGPSAAPPLPSLSLLSQPSSSAPPPPFNQHAVRSGFAPSLPRLALSLLPPSLPLTTARLTPFPAHLPFIPPQPTPNPLFSALPLPPLPPLIPLSTPSASPIHIPNADLKTHFPLPPTTTHHRLDVLQAALRLTALVQDTTSTAPSLHAHVHLPLAMQKLHPTHSTSKSKSKQKEAEEEEQEMAESGGGSSSSEWEETEEEDEEMESDEAMGDVKEQNSLSTAHRSHSKSKRTTTQTPGHHHTLFSSSFNLACLML